MPLLDILSSVFGGGSAVSNAVGKGIDRLIDLIPDKEKAAEAQREFEAELLKAGIQEAADQRSINLKEAENASVFVSGWRPAVAWVCVVALALYFWPKFFLGAIFWTVATWQAGHLLPYPDLGITDITGLLGSLLGFGSMRTFEKYVGVDTKSVGGK